LHDGVGQYLVAIKMSLDVALSEDEDPGVVREALSDCRELAIQCTAEVRTMSHLLHPPLLEEMGLASALRWYAEGFEERSGITVELEVPSEFDRLPQPIEMVLFRVLQESLTNVHRHSGSKLARIRLAIDSENAVLTIQDRGKGFTQSEERTRTGVGLAGMRERVQERGGRFEIEATPRGTTVSATLPL
jgi:signal transduction histidine kinase